MRGKLLKGGLVVLGAIVLSTLGTFAADSMRGVDHNLSALTGAAGGVCPEGTALVKDGNFCVDVYEDSADTDCPNKDPKSTVETNEDVAKACGSVSVPGRLPWRNVSLTQAQSICAVSGKRLPTSDEWYKIALGTQPDACVTDAANNQPALTGSADCVSTVGAHDAIGNVWEWVNETVTNGSFHGRDLPPEGYVSSVDQSGVAITTNDKPQDIYQKDYFWSKSDGTYGMIRGGFYAGQSDAGLFALNATVPTSFASPGVGFRCVKDL